MSSLTLTVEILVGTPIERGAQDLQTLCDKLGGVSVTAMFNDVTLTALEAGTAAHLAERYRAELQQPDRNPISGRPSLRMAFSR